MFSLFKKQIHDAIETQHEDLRSEPIGPHAMAGLDCDQLPNARGPFGQSWNNPIPVNGMLGTYKYLGKLLSPTGVIFYFHRIGSMASEVASNPVDAYEVVDMNGKNWDILFLDMYHPRRSNSVPAGYQYKDYDKKMGDIPFAFGVDIYCKNFPHDLPEAIESHNNLAVFARKVRERVEKGGFNRPENHALKVAGIKAKLASLRT